MSMNTAIVNPRYPLAELGVDASTAIGAQILALRLRRYWLDQHLDVPCEMYVVEARSVNGRAIYSARLDMKNARKVDDHRRMQLILSIEDEAGVFA